ncbi:MAG TPA: tetratricopeptide repeat protein [Vicinamibacterales bacterium]
MAGATQAGPAGRRPLVVIVIVVMGLLAGVTALLASVHAERRAALAQAHRDRGDALVARGELAAAVVEYRSALALERGHLETGRALALALLQLGRVGEAEAYLTDLLRQDPTSGPLNLAMARVQALRDRHDPARAYYQRAIYGVWPDGAPDNRMAIRFELIEFLEDHGTREEVVAELLRLKAELPPEDVDGARRTAARLVNAGALDAAIQLLQATRAAVPDDVELLSDLAAAEAAAGRRAEAAGTLRRALAIGRDRADLRDRLHVIERVLALDPHLPRLRLAARARRARQVLAAVHAQTRACANATPDAAAAAAEAEARLKRRPPADAEAAEAELTLAARLWRATPGCHDESVEARALAEVLGDTAAPVEEPAP